MVLIAVHGTASRFLPAERGTVHLAIELEHDDRATVLQQVAALHERFVAEARALVEAGAATRWSSAQVWFRSEHRYEGPEEARPLVQIASASVQVRFQDLAALSSWVFDAGSLAGVSIDRIEWEVTRAHRAEAERALRVEAVQDAIERAKAYASAIGGTDVVLQAVWEEGLRQGSTPAQGVWATQRMSAKSDAELRPDDIEIGASVTADFSVEPVA